ncbi:EAL domain-containing protein [Thalassotalea ponticola]|uniref:EAL and HDOD domain-containing protein n=1 Tax=Thalassotalea ponticola TaxID=1523392 RepID=UPI0025B60D8C|nr:EAL domain-containing protein [Thalassotalea ponticola]MDN3651653.1 EAL domain-containing protein [Thalassotalea ponticola]
MSRFAARQAIVNKDQQIIAYELLFRDSLVNAFPEVNALEATQALLQTALQSRQSKTFTQQKPAFINFTTELLKSDIVLQFQPKHIVVEILETEAPTTELLALCKMLHSKGYVIALDDFIHQNDWSQFFPYIQIIKVDVKQSSTQDIQHLLEQLTDYQHIQLLAEKIESDSQYQQAKHLGFDLFQGYFFSEPEVIESKPNHLEVAGLQLEFS